MRSFSAVHVLTIAFALAPATVSGQTEPSVAALGACRVQSGETIRECRVAYRTFGTLSPQRDNVVLIPTWFMGRSSDWVPLLGPSGIVDTTRFFVVVVDALGNGMSSSPSNSPLQPGSPFPAITIRDMVESQYRLLTEHMQISHVHAVVGISMGGMQAFEFGVAHPEFADRLVPIVGSPRLAAYDRVLWMAQLSAIENGERYGVPDDTVFLHLSYLSQLVGSTPARVNETDPNQIGSHVAAFARDVAGSLQLDDFAAQLRAMLAHDVSRPYRGDLQQAASTISARVFAVYSPDDHVVTSGPTASFARQLGADTLSVPSMCGHGVFRCELPAVGAAVRAFLER